MIFHTVEATTAAALGESLRRYQLLNQGCMSISRQTGVEESVATGHLYQKLVVHLMKRNSALLLNRIPTFPNNHIDGSE
jgi:hypothetical protein